MTVWNKNHFNTISEEIVDVRKNVGESTAEKRAVNEALDRLVDQLSITFENSNDGFRRSRFFDSCDVPADSPVRTTD